MPINLTKLPSYSWNVPIIYTCLLTPQRGARWNVFYRVLGDDGGCQHGLTLVCLQAEDINFVWDKCIIFFVDIYNQSYKNFFTYASYMIIKAKSISKTNDRCFQLCIMLKIIHFPQMAKRCCEKSDIEWKWYYYSRLLQPWPLTPKINIGCLLVMIKLRLNYSLVTDWKPIYSSWSW